MLDHRHRLGPRDARRLLTQQATIIAYDNNFKLLMYLTLASMPLVFVIGVARGKPAVAAAPPAPAH